MSAGARKPTLTVIAGPNGAGKTTLVKGLEADGHPLGHYVNPDEIAAVLGGDSRGRELRAGREAIHQARAHIAAGESFTQETTLTGAWAKTLMKEAKTAGFTVRMVYIGVEDLAVSQARVDDRVEKGGHAVPAADQRRRFDRSFDNLAPASRIADSAVILDNSRSATPYVLVAEVERGQVRSMATEAPAWARRSLANLEQRSRMAKTTQQAERVAASALKAADSIKDPARRAAAADLAAKVADKARAPTQGRPGPAAGPKRGGGDRQR